MWETPFKGAQIIKHFTGPLFLLLASWSSIMINGFDVEGFFPDVKQNLTKITWAHAVNNQSYLNDTLNDDSINMIEADVIMGTLKNSSSEKLPVMCHPPENKSDLSLESFLKQVFVSNTNKSTKKGIKLDFKSTEAFNCSINIVNNSTNNFTQEIFLIWINADILSGPIDADPATVDANIFLQGAKTFPNSTLSIGWTTKYEDSDTGAYNSNQISAMVDVINNNNVTQNITFPVRAGLAAQSIDLLMNLTELVPNSTLTIWSSKGDNVDVEKLRLLIKENGLNKTFIDVPSDLLQQLHLDNLPNGGSSLRNSVWFTCLAMWILGFAVKWW